MALVIEVKFIELYKNVSPFGHIAGSLEKLGFSILLARSAEGRSAKKLNYDWPVSAKRDPSQSPWPFPTSSEIINQPSQYPASLYGPSYGARKYGEHLRGVASRDDSQWTDA